MGAERKESALILFLKYPEKGKVKTRLSKDIGEEKAVAIYKRLVSHTLKVAYEIFDSLDVLIFYTGGKSNSEWNQYARDVFIQEGNDLGERMLNAFLKVEELGYKKRVVIGSDCPGLQSRMILETLEGLDYSELVIGPAEDGGYYLMGMCKTHASLFQDIEWSTAHVLSDTLHIANRLGLGIEFLETLNDIDVQADLAGHEWLLAND